MYFDAENARKEKSTIVRDKQNPTKMRTAADSRKPPRSGLVQGDTLRKNPCRTYGLGYHKPRNSILQFYNFISLVFVC